MAHSNAADVYTRRSNDTFGALECAVECRSAPLSVGRLVSNELVIDEIENTSTGVRNYSKTNVLVQCFPKTFSFTG